MFLLQNVERIIVKTVGDVLEHFLSIGSVFVRGNGMEHSVRNERSINHTEELETLKTSIGENEDAIEQLEAQPEKLDESIKEVSEEIDQPVCTLYRD